VLLEATALGATGLVAVAGSAAAAAVGRQAGVPVWVVAGEGRVLPDLLWEAVTSRLAVAGPAWERDEEIVPLAWVDAVMGPSGVASPQDAAARPTCPPAPELVTAASR
jgi:hypothetical protein